MSATLALVPAIRRVAAMPAAPAPMTTISTSLTACAANAGAPAEAAEAADAARNRRRLSTVMVNRLLTPQPCLNRMRFANRTYARFRVLHVNQIAITIGINSTHHKTRGCDRAQARE